MSERVIVCRDCGEDIERGVTALECGCRLGFVAGWDQCLGHGRFLGRIVGPWQIKNPKPEEG